MLVSVIRKPCTTSALVARKVTGVLAGTRMHWGVNEYCWPTTRTMTDPSACRAVPRLLSMNSPDTCSVVGSMVSTRDGGIIAQCRPVNTTIATRMTIRPTARIAHLRSMRAATSASSV